MKDYNKLFQSLIQELQRSKYIKIDTSESDFNILKKSHLSYFDFSIPDKHGFQIPKEKHTVFNAFKQSRVYWFYEIDEQQKGAGDFFLKNFYHTLDNDIEKLWNEDTSEDDLKILKQFRILIDSPDAGDNKVVGIHLESGKYSENLWFYNRGRLYPMTVDYEGLLNALLETRGIGNWEYFFCDFDPAFTLDTYIPEALRKDLEALKILFPDTDYGFYEERLEGLGV